MPDLRKEKLVEIAEFEKYLIKNSLNLSYE